MSVSISLSITRQIHKVFLLKLQNIPEVAVPEIVMFCGLLRWFDVPHADIERSGGSSFFLILDAGDLIDWISVVWCGWKLHILQIIHILFI